MGNKTPSALLLMGGKCSPDSDQGDNPSVEYRCLRRDYGFPILSFDTAETGGGLAALLHKRVGPYWALALKARFQTPVSRSVVATGEDIGFPAALVNAATGAGKWPLAIIMHGSYFGSRKVAPVLRILRSLPGVRFLCLSESLRQRMITRYHVPPERVLNVSYGVDTDYFTLTAPDATPNRQIMSAGMAMRDYRTLTTAARALPDITVRIAADSAWFRSDLDIESESLPENVVARSYGNYRNLRELYRESAFAVVPLYEAVHACGYAVILEAMAMGKPVITSRITGRSDFVVDGETGFYVPPGDPEALRDRIRYLMDRPELIRDMGQRARKLVLEKYTVQAYAARIAAAVGVPPLVGEEFMTHV